MLPNYQDGIIVNLMSSIITGLGGKSNYKPLSAIAPQEIAQAQNVVLMVIDGLGYDSVQELGKKSYLGKQHLGKITTVFPSTTTAAITTFFTGVSPQEHGMTAWYMYMKEFNTVVAILPFCAKDKNQLRMSKAGLAVPASIFTKIKVESHIVLKKSFNNSPYNSLFQDKAIFWGYNNLRSFGSAVRKAVLSSTRKKYIYAYWPGFDDFSHFYGKEDQKTRKHLQEIDVVIERICEKLQGTNTLLLITADHGQITTTAKKTIIIEKHPLLKECMSKPLCGEPRAAFFYIKPQKQQQFERYIKHKLGRYCILYRSAELAEKGYFGRGKPHLNFKDRIGDYILIPKENYIIRESLITKEKPLLLGHHGGLSEGEMLVPLIKIKV